MNYFLIHIGKIPKHLNHCVSQIKKVDKDSNIILGLDKNINIENVEVLNLNHVCSERTKEIINMNLFSTEENKLWATSLHRLFYLYDIGTTTNLKQFVHFDNDVLIFKKFDEIKEEFHDDKFNITPLTNDQLIFGYSFVPNLSVFDQILDKVFEYLSNLPKEELKSIKSKKLNEMKLMRIIYEDNKELFNLLNVLPGSSKFIFDPASYGQFLTGTKDKFSKKFIDNRHIVGKQIELKNIYPLLDRKSPLVKFENRKYELVNLHIHSKKLKKYMS